MVALKKHLSTLMKGALIDNTNLLGQFLSSHDENGFLATVNYDLNKQMIASIFK